MCFICIMFSSQRVDVLYLRLHCLFMKGTKERSASACTQADTASGPNETLAIQILLTLFIYISVHLA